MNPRTQLIIAVVAAFILGLLIGRQSPNPTVEPVVVPAAPTSTMQMDHSAMMMTTSSAMDMSGMMQGMMAGLQGKTGDAFDQAFLDEMIVHHQGAIDMAKAVLTSSNRPELKTLANAIIAAQTAEIQQMQAWRTQWFQK